MATCVTHSSRSLSTMTSAQIRTACRAKNAGAPSRWCSLPERTLPPPEGEGEDAAEEPKPLGAYALPVHAPERHAAPAQLVIALRWGIVR